MNTMRDVFISALCDRMAGTDSVFFLSADLGAPALDRLRQQHPDRFINVGIAEQSCINTATGLALEGFNAYAYGIAPFISMRCLEQCRVNLALTNVVRPLNLTILSLGCGLSYDISGPSHHCLEDISLLRTLPGIEIYSPSTLEQARALCARTLETSAPRYIRLDGKPCPETLGGGAPDFDKGFEVVRAGTGPTIVATGYMLRTALAAAEQLGSAVSAQVVDVFRLDRLDAAAFAKAVSGGRGLLTLEEAFIGCGGLDAFVNEALGSQGLRLPVRHMGMPRSYEYSNGDRQHLHQVNGIDADRVARAVALLAQA